MWEGLNYKFKQNNDLAELLLKTKYLKLVEGNKWHDNYWGQCYCYKCSNIKGYNILGIMLMKIRKNFIYQ